MPKLTFAMILLASPAVPWGELAQASQNVVVVLDDSGSMDSRMRSRRGEKKIEAAKSALQVVLGQLPPDAKVGILLLNGSPRGSQWIIPMGPVDIESSQDALQQVRADGGTPLGQRMKQAADALLELRQRQHYGDYRLLVVTDGEATDGRLVARYLPDILSRGLTVDVIGVDMKSDHSLATQVDSYRRADDPESLERAIRAVFAETAAVDNDRQTDFEFLAGFPSEVAAAALAALAEAGNEPIGSTVNSDLSTDQVRLRPPAAPVSAREKKVSSWLVYGILLLIVLLTFASKKKRRGR